MLSRRAMPVVAAGRRSGHRGARHRWRRDRLGLGFGLIGFQHDHVDSASQHDHLIPEDHHHDAAEDHLLRTSVLDVHDGHLQRTWRDVRNHGEGDWRIGLDHHHVRRRRSGVRRSRRPWSTTDLQGLRRGGGQPRCAGLCRGQRGQPPSDVPDRLPVAACAHLLAANLSRNHDDRAGDGYHRCGHDHHEDALARRQALWCACIVAR